MATQPKLVNKQFNTPIGLYSDQNVREVLERESQLLSNGAVGINFQNSNVGKPSNLQNSAVLRMLEEEEHRQRNGHAASNDYVPRSLRENIQWPPPEYKVKNGQRSRFEDVVIPGTKRVAWPPPPDSVENYQEQAPVASQGGPQYVSQQTPDLQNNNTNPSTPKTAPLAPLNISTARLTNSPTVHQSPNSPNLNLSPSGFRPATPSKQWAPVYSPVQQSQYSAPQPKYQVDTTPYQVSPLQQYQAPPPQQQYQVLPSQQQYQAATPQPQYKVAAPQQQYQAAPQQQPYQVAPSKSSVSPQYFNQLPPSAQPVLATVPSQHVVQKVVEPPPATITLRPQAPVSQISPPVYNSQPATATLKGGKNLRGDTKWPPEVVKSQMEEENRQRIELARGPAFRPRKVKKDYSSFFAQHALNSTYPGYKVPPGTQFYKP